MASFFEKLKKGMGVKIIEEEPLEIKENLKERFPKEPARKKTIKKVKISKLDLAPAKISKFDLAPAKKESDLIQQEVKEIEKEELKKPELPKPETKKEEELMPKKPFFQKIAEKQGPEDERRDFNLQNLRVEEGQLAVDVYQTDAEIVIQSTIAGVKPEGLDISIEADTVLIRGERKEPSQQEEKNYFYQECYWGPFSRQIILPEETDPSRAEAQMKEGVLTIRIPKIERKKKRKIAVRG